MEIKDQRTKSLLWLLIILLVGLLSGATGYLLATTESTAQREDLQNQINNLQKQINDVNDTTSTTTSSTDDETADWKTYTNEEYGFSFKYPKDWVKTNTNEGLVQLYNADTEAGRELLESETKIVVYVKATSTVGDLTTYVTNNDGNINSTSNVTVGGKSGKKFIVKPELGTKTTAVYVLNDSTYYEIICMENSENFDNILSSFQFTN